jgi:hypothetical protein
MSSKIRFYVDKFDLCTPECPFNMQKKHQPGILTVGSIGCRACEHFIKRSDVDDSELYTECKLELPHIKPEVTVDISCVF